MLINIVAVGKMTDKYYSSATAEYIKRLGSYSDVNLIEVKEKNFSKAPSKGEIDIILSYEAAKIKKHVSGIVVVMDIKGTLYSSEEFAELIADLKNKGNSTITFVVGGSYGIADEIKQLSTHKISFSKMTFPHQLFRVILSEQIYRAFTINANTPYHK